MRGLQIRGPNDVGVAEIPMEAMGSNRVRVHVDLVGLCGTDFALTSGTLGLNTLPVVPGHEVVGTVKESSSSQFIVGDMVVLDPLMNCGTCWACLKDRPQWCSQVGVVGVVRNGGACEELVLPSHQWIVLPPGVSLEAAVLIEPVHVAQTVLDVAGSVVPEHVLVIGTGALGLIIIESLQHQWPHARIVAYDAVAEHLDHALTIGAMRLEDKDSGSFELVIDGVGALASMELAGTAVRPGGHIVVYGVPKAHVSIPKADVLFRKNVAVSFSRLYSHDFDHAVKWVADGIIRPEEIVCDRLSLDEAAVFLSESRWNRPERWGKTLIQMN